ncbi:MAG: DUF1800 domain-containing protein [Jiangellaceae bacterium]
MAGAGSALLKGWPDDTHTRPGTHARSPGTVADPIPLDEVKRSPTPQRPVAAGTFADRDESFAASGTSSDDHKPKRPEPPPEGRLLSGPAAAAAAATSFDSPFLATDRPEMHLARRATIGPSQGDIAAIEEQGIDRWLTDQLDPARADPEGDAAFALFPLAGKDAAGVAASIERFHWDAMVETGQATLARQMWSRRQLYEVTVDVFANHLNVTMPFDGGWDVGPSYHQDVIRGHAFGRFADMLLAAMKHPAMLRYLNNDESTKQSVNENLGRELLELHTVGIEGGYDEDDVRNSAYILTGRTTDGETGAYRYAADRHYTGPVQVLDFSHANGAPDGDAVADAYLTYLATHPATARSIARKLAVRFVADSPPPSLVDRLQQSYLESGTAIVPVLVTLFSSTEFWEAVGHKTRRPLENLVASLRTVGVTPGPDAGATRKAVENLYWGLQEVGHQPLRWSPPNGYPDVQAAWTSAGALLATWNVHRGVVQGWWEGLGYPEPESMVDDATTSGEYVDALCRRLTGQAFPAAAREALLEFAGAASDEPVGSQPLGGRVPHVAPLVLDSIYFALR